MAAPIDVLRRKVRALHEQHRFVEIVEVLAEESARMAEHCRSVGWSAADWDRTTKTLSALGIEIGY